MMNRQYPRQTPSLPTAVRKFFCARCRAWQLYERPNRTRLDTTRAAAVSGSDPMSELATSAAHVARILVKLGDPEPKPTLIAESILKWCDPLSDVGRRASLYLTPPRPGERDHKHLLRTAIDAAWEDLAEAADSSAAAAAAAVSTPTVAQAPGVPSTLSALTQGASGATALRTRPLFPLPRGLSAAAASKLWAAPPANARADVASRGAEHCMKFGRAGPLSPVGTSFAFDEMERDGLPSGSQVSAAGHLAELPVSEVHGLIDSQALSPSITATAHPLTYP